MPRLRIALSTAATTLLLVLLAGCGSGNTTLEGTVTFGGQPVDGGAIVLVASGGKDVATGARIVDGKYLVTAKADKLPPGTYKVQINWLKGTGKKVKSESDPDVTVEETQEVIPLEYNVQSKLSAEIKTGSNTANFELKAGGAVGTTPAGPAAGGGKAVNKGVVD
jgi:hypothetical protein